MDCTLLQEILIPQFSDGQWEAIGQALDSLPLTDKELRKAAGLNADNAGAVLLGAYLLKMVNLQWLVFHKDSDIACNTRDWLDGFEPAPHKCEFCQDTITEQQQTYKLQAVQYGL